MFKKNNTTQWYVFFNIYEETDRLVHITRYIGNNHIIAQSAAPDSGWR